MLAMTIWFIAIVLEVLILFRCIRTGVFRVYFAFFVYVGCVFIGDATLPFISKMLSARTYQTCYWSKEFVCVIAGYAVLMEIIDRAFAYFEGPKKLGRNAALIIFAAIVAFTGLQSVFDRASNTARTWIQIEANLRGAEIILLSIVIVVISYYSIPVGRNLKGIIVGYGICTAAVALSEVFRTFAGPSFQSAFSTIWSYSYVASLLIWIVSLWSYQPNPKPAISAAINHSDYEALASRTRATLAGVRGYLRKAVGS